MSKLKYIAIATLIFVVSFVGGCCGMDMHLQTADANEPKRVSFIESEIVIANDGWFEIYKDNTTGVHYLLYKGGTGVGMCVMVNAEGKPLVSKE